MSVDAKRRAQLAVELTRAGCTNEKLRDDELKRQDKTTQDGIAFIARNLAVYDYMKTINRVGFFPTLRETIPDGMSEKTISFRALAEHLLRHRDGRDLGADESNEAMAKWKENKKSLSIFVGPWRRKVITLRKYNYAYDLAGLRKSGNLLPLLSKYHMFTTTDRYRVDVPHERKGAMFLDRQILNKEYLGGIAKSADHLWILNFEELDFQNDLGDFGWSSSSPTLEEASVLVFEKTPNCLGSFRDFDALTLRRFAVRKLMWTLEPKEPPFVADLSDEKSPKKRKLDESLDNKMEIGKQMVRLARTMLQDKGALSGEDAKHFIDAMDVYLGVAAEAKKKRQSLVVDGNVQDNSDSPQKIKEARYAKLDLSALSQEMMREEQNAKSNEQAAESDVHPRTTKERAKIRKWLSKQKFSANATECRDGSMNILAKDERAFHALRYVFDDPTFEGDDTLGDDDRENAYVDWLNKNLKHWKVIDTDESKREIKLNKNTETKR